MPRKEIRAKRLGIPVEKLPDGRGRHNSHSRGSLHHKWNSSLISSDGYRLVRVGTSHPLACPNGYVREHILIMASVVGIGALQGKIVHHINGDKFDNRLENLELTDPSSHNKIHNLIKQRDRSSGRFVGKRRSGRLLDGREWNEVPV